MGELGGFGFGAFEALVTDLECAWPVAEERLLFEHLPGGVPVVHACDRAVILLAKVARILCVKARQSSQHQKEHDGQFQLSAQLTKVEKGH